MTVESASVLAPSQGRSVRIDALKALASLLVVTGHVIALPQYQETLYGAYWLIAGVNMPLFMFLAGWVLYGREGDSPVRFIKRKFLALIVPYFMWLMIPLVSWSPPSAWPGLLGQAAIDPHDPSRMWFLYVLFVFYAIFVLARLVSKHDAALLVVAAGTIGLSALPGGDYLGRFYMWLFAFFVLGYLASKHRARLARPRPWMVPVTIAGLVGCYWLAAPAGPGESSYRLLSMLADRGLGSVPTTIAYFAVRFATASLGIALCFVVYGLIDEKRLGLQAQVGRRSLGIYVAQAPLLGLAVGSTALHALGSSALIAYVALAVVLLLERSPVTSALMLGRWKARPA